MAVLDSILLLGIPWAGRWTEPRPDRGWWVPMVVLPLLLWAIAALSIIVGYVLTDDPLPVQRLGWKTAIRLQDWRSADYRPPAMDPYRAFVTDLKHTVVLTFPDRKIVLSPANPGEFVDSVLPRQTNA